MIVQLLRAVKYNSVCRVAGGSFTAKCLGNKMSDKILCWQVEKRVHMRKNTRNCMYTGIWSKLAITTYARDVAVIANHFIKKSKQTNKTPKQTTTKQQQNSKHIRLKLREVAKYTIGMLWITRKGTKQKS